MQVPASLPTPFWLAGLTLAVGAVVYLLDWPQEITLVMLVVAGLMSVLDWLFSQSG